MGSSNTKSPGNAPPNQQNSNMNKDTSFQQKQTTTSPSPSNILSSSNKLIQSQQNLTDTSISNNISSNNISSNNTSPSETFYNDRIYSYDNSEQTVVPTQTDDKSGSQVLSDSYFSYSKTAVILTPRVQKSQTPDGKHKMNQYVIGPIIGEGKYAIVRHVIDENTNQAYVCTLLHPRVFHFYIYSFSYLRQ